MAVQHPAPRYPVAWPVPLGITSQGYLLRVGQHHRFLESDGRSITLRDLRTGDTIAEVVGALSDGRFICDMTWVGDDHVVYYDCGPDDEEYLAITLVRVSTRTRVRAVLMPRGSMTPCESLTAIDDRHVLFQSFAKPLPVFGVVCNVFTGEQVRIIRMPQPEFEMDTPLLNRRVNVWRTPLVVAQGKFVLGLRINVFAHYEDASNPDVAFDVHDVHDRSGAVRTLPITVYKHDDIKDVQALASAPRVVVSTASACVVVCVETGRELRSILHLPETVPVRTVSLSCDRIVQYAWDRHARRHQAVVVAFSHGAAEPHVVRGVHLSNDTHVLQRAGDYHFVALRAPSPAGAPSRAQAWSRNLAVFSALGSREHMAAWLLCRRLRRCANDPGFALCRRLLASRTEQSAAREDAQRRAELAVTRKRCLNLAASE